jgi:hypothetical protein
MDVRTQGREGPHVPPLDKCLEQIRAKLDKKKAEWLQELQRHPERFRALEEKLHEHFQELADDVMASLLAEGTSASPALEREKKR